MPVKPLTPTMPTTSAARQVQGGWLTFVLVLIGRTFGMGLAIARIPETHANPYPSLPAVSEPAVTKELGRALIADDAITLSRIANAEVLQALGEAIQPISRVFELRFIGAVERNGEI